MHRFGQCLGIFVIALLISMTLVSCTSSQKSSDQSAEQKPAATPQSPQNPSDPGSPVGSSEKTPPVSLTEETELPQETGQKRPDSPGDHPGPGPTTPPSSEIKNPDTLVVAYANDVASLDPASANDPTSSQVIFQIYENLIMYDGPSTERFVPMLAEQVPSLENGLIKPRPDGSYVISFPIRQGVRFHDGSELTPEDVAYSFQRLLLLDRRGGPSWLLLSPLLGVNTAEGLAMQIEAKDKRKQLSELEFGKLSEETLMKTCDRVLRAVQVNGDHVEFHLPTAFAPFFALLTHGAGGGGIINKRWAIAQGAWDGQCATWTKFHNPEVDQNPLRDKANGTGPFKLESWDRRGGVLTLVRHESYWREPAKLQKVLIQSVPTWRTRQAMLERGDADIVTVERANAADVENATGVRLIRGQLQMTMSYFMLNQSIQARNNAYLGSGKLDGQGIPPDFFRDVRVRKAFAYSFDWEAFLREIWQGDAQQAPGPLPGGLAFSHPQTYRFDLKSATELFKAAWAGKVWEKGFKFTALYASGDETDKAALELLSRRLREINPKFVLEIAGVDFATLLNKSRERMVPLYPAGWAEDYHDAHNWLYPIMHSQGFYSAHLGIGTRYDAQIDAALKTYDETKRQQLYAQLQARAYEDVPVIFLVQAAPRHYQRRWVDGYYFNPAWPGPNFYILSKQAAAQPNPDYISRFNLQVQEW
jgi:peptide/nickel transport system substrate-binding protein